MSRSRNTPAGNRPLYHPAQDDPQADKTGDGAAFGRYTCRAGARLTPDSTFGDIEPARIQWLALVCCDPAETSPMLI